MSLLYVGRSCNPVVLVAILILILILIGVSLNWTNPGQDMANLAAQMLAELLTRSEARRDAEEADRRVRPWIADEVE